MVASDPAAVAARTEALFRSSGALRDGHFLLKSGRHGDRYLEKFQVLQHPAMVTELCAMLVAGIEPGSGSVGLACGPTTGGVVLAFEVARQLGVRGIFAEEVRAEDGTPRREFRRGFRIEPGERVVLVDDILTTGGSVQAMLPAIESAGGELVHIGVLADRSGGTTEVTSSATGRAYPISALWRPDMPTFEPGPATCPGCRDGLALDAPGSTGAATAPGGA